VRIPTGWLGPLIPALSAGCVRALGATLRMEIGGTDSIERFWAEQRALIYIVWHGRILMVPWLNERLRRERRARPVTVLASRSRDGELVARYVERFGLGVVRGSSSRGGAGGLRGLARTVSGGGDVAVVPDGPRGPRGQLQPGVVTLASLTGAPVVPFAFAARPAHRAASWDEFLVPLPFARCTLLFGDPVVVPRDADRLRAAKVLEQALADVTADADRRVRP
jgi:lysophospholipid acyltransferase (LPLAT)-like uncharacterized protein